jgi:hypothetical protein
LTSPGHQIVPFQDRSDNLVKRRFSARPFARDLSIHGQTAHMPTCDGLPDLQRTQQLFDGIQTRTLVITIIQLKMGEFAYAPRHSTSNRVKRPSLLVSMLLFLDISIQIFILWYKIGCGNFSLIKTRCGLFVHQSTRRIFLLPMIEVDSRKFAVVTVEKGRRPRQLS